MQVKMLTRPTLSDSMVLCHPDMFNKYCLCGAPSFSLLRNISVAPRIIPPAKRAAFFIDSRHYFTELSAVTVVYGMFALP